MSPPGWQALLLALPGAGFAVGALLLLSWWRSVRRPDLARRVGPYLADVVGPPPAPGRFRHRVRAGVRALARYLDRLCGGPRSVNERLQRLADGAAESSDPLAVERFRAEQLLWAAGGAAAAGALLVAAGSLSPGTPSLVIALAALGGGLARDHALTRQVARRERLLGEHLPVLADLLALAVAAGESPGPALARVVRAVPGPLAQRVRRALAEARDGVPLAVALQQAADRCPAAAPARFLQTLAVALERGTPLAQVLRDQAVDVRAARRRELVEAGGVAEIAMLFPVVFVLLPATVVVAVYPGLSLLGG